MIHKTQKVGWSDVRAYTSSLGWTELIVYTITIVLAILSIALTDPKFSTPLAVAVLLVGYQFASLFRESKTDTAMQRINQETTDAIRDVGADNSRAFQDLGKQIPALGHLEVLSNTEAAYDYLIGALGAASSVLNTRILVSAESAAMVPVTHPWRQALRKYVKRGGIAREIVSRQDDLVTDSQELRTSAGGDKYQFRILAPTSVFMNFTILEYDDGRRDSQEVVLGWAIAAGVSFNEQCFVLRGRDVREVFSDIFRALWDSSVSS